MASSKNKTQCWSSGRGLNKQVTAGHLTEPETLQRTEKINKRNKGNEKGGGVEKKRKKALAVACSLGS